MKPLRIYVAGAYTPKDCDLHEATRIANLNTDKAIEIGNKLMDKGHYVFVPHLSHYLHVRSNVEREGDWWYEMDNTYLDLWANALFLVSHSYGADMELKLAKKLGYKIFYKISQVSDLTQEK